MQKPQKGVLYMTIFGVPVISFHKGKVFFLPGAQAASKAKDIFKADTSKQGCRLSRSCTRIADRHHGFVAIFLEFLLVALQIAEGKVLGVDHMPGHEMFFVANVDHDRALVDELNGLGCRNIGHTLGHEPQFVSDDGKGHRENEQHEKWMIPGELHQLTHVFRSSQVIRARHYSKGACLAGLNRGPKLASR